jgi:hypothetical protein
MLVERADLLRMMRLSISVVSVTSVVVVVRVVVRSGLPSAAHNSRVSPLPTVHHKTEERNWSTSQQRAGAGSSWISSCRGVRHQSVKRPCMGGCSGGSP